MRITVRLFGAFREAVGAPRVVVEARNVGDLIRVLFREYPALRDHPVLVAVNQEMVSDPQHPLCPGDEVAVFPPVGGG